MDGRRIKQAIADRFLADQRRIAEEEREWDRRAIRLTVAIAVLAVSYMAGVYWLVSWLMARQAVGG